MPVGSLSKRAERQTDREGSCIANTRTDIKQAIRKRCSKETEATEGAENDTQLMLIVGEI